MTWNVVDGYLLTIVNSLVLLLVTSVVAASAIAATGYLARPRSVASLPNLAGLLAAFALLGTVTGVIAGISQEGLVSAFLTGVLGVVSSLLALAFGRTALAGFRPILPHALSVLLLSALTGLVIGSAFRAFGDVAKRSAADYRTQYDQVWAPVERERRLQLLKSCMDAAKTHEDKLAC